MTATLDPATRPPAGRRLALLAVSLGFALVQLDVSVVNVAVRAIGSDLGAGTSSLQWVVDAYTLALASLILGAGTLGDRVGAKRVYLAGIALFTVASAGCGAAPGVGTLIAARAVQGIGASVLIPCSLTLLSHAHPGPAERQRAVGMWAAGASVTLSGGPLVGGALTSLLGWRAIFFVNVPVGLLTLLLTWRQVADTPRSPRRVDPAGQVLGVLTLLALAYAVVGAGHDGIAAAPVLAAFAVTTAAGVAFVVAESRVPAPMLPLDQFRIRAFTATAAIGLLLNVAVYGLLFVLSLWWQEVQGWSAVQAGLGFLPMTLAVMAANLLAGRLVAAVGAGRTVAAGAVAMAASLAGLLVVGRSTPFAALVVQLVVLGAGVGALVPAMTAASLDSVRPERSGLAAGTLNTARQAGSVVGVALFGSLASRSLTAGLRAGLLVAVGLSLAILAAAAGVSAAGARER